MKVLSLFDGMSCGQIALKELGITPEVYYASEIDRFAIAQTQLNFPNTVQLGDVTKWREWDVDWSSVDLLLAGSPCQGFSFAGKQLAFDDPRSALFFVFIDILNHIRAVNPGVKFLLENVNMPKVHREVIDRYIGILPARINSNLVSAQNRDRWYWSNIRTSTEGLFGELATDIPQPKDRGLLLRDILDPEVDERYYLEKTKFDFQGMSISGKSRTLRVSGKSSQSDKHNCDIIKIDKKGKIKPNQDKASCFTAGAHSGGNHSDMDLICVAMRGRNPENPSSRTKGNPTVQRLEPNLSGKTNCLTSVGKDNLVMQINKIKERGAKKRFYLNENHTTGDKWVNKNYRPLDGKGNALLTCSHKGNRANGMSLVPEEHRIRRLTPMEATRLQTIPDWYKWECSDTQQYRMLGNGWTVEVIKHILKYLEK